MPRTKDRNINFCQRKLIDPPSGRQKLMFLSTYVTRNALKIRSDYPVMAALEVNGGEIIEPEATQSLGHILGRLAYIRRWTAGADESTRKVEWIVNRSGRGPLEVTVTAWAHKAGRDQKRLTISNN